MSELIDSRARRRGAPLSVAQAAALEWVREGARGRRDAALARLTALAVADPAVLVAAVRGHGRVTLNFHPDRLLADGRSVAGAISADGRYRNQFETRISNGSRTAFPGGDRDGWERELFGGAYHGPAVSPGERPKYGGLNLMDHSDGASPRFGSCHLRLRTEVLERCTFCVGDSHLRPADFGTVDAFDDVLAGLLEHAQATTGQALGAACVDVAEYLRGLPGTPGAAVGSTPRCWGEQRRPWSANRIGGSSGARSTRPCSTSSSSGTSW